ncbi:MULTISPECIES: ArsI/CadI family heavy metal resistance metalloenzyme [unclassified Minwuia]|jgi:catechol 2,3-dioxygenase-like lactoylglutathione lyase family enzyme|uniref:ArsI/CadI family heavy metal resistance metalloenzyme n=1 Tax=unclassified Minwuia TaxID=2618799 RepID=UPI002479D4FD|nr:MULTISPECIES: ArsI/CadI family heavy metal resistance metalloenzyme [unclassified Minwuia]
MKRLHVHIAVSDLERSKTFYSTMFDVAPTVEKHDYAKWMLDDPAVNFAISTRAGRSEGLDHLGLQVDTDAEVEEIEARMAAAEEMVAPQRDAACCYAKGNKSWSRDPAGVPWETFHTMAEIQFYGSDHQPLDEVEKPASGGACCG